jgi:hypothetical protein
MIVFDKSLSTHNVNTLLNNIHGQLNLTQAEEKLLKETENYVIWQGRYPIPKKKKCMVLIHMGQMNIALNKNFGKNLRIF